MTPEQVALLNDASLSDAARVLGLYISTLPEGDHELSHDTLSALLHGTPNPDTVGRHLRQLRVHGYIERTSKGGSGSPRYKWSARENSRAEEAVPAKIHGQEPTVVAGAVGDTPFNSPEPIDVRALRAIEQAGDKLSGCRGSLVDYLTARVPQPNQYSYVQAVVSWIDNPLATFRRPDGMPVPTDERAKLLAVALNEMAATDEATRKHRAGDPANLRNKLGIVIRDRYREASPATGTDGGRSYPRRGKKPIDQQDYTPQDKPIRWNR